MVSRAMDHYEIRPCDPEPMKWSGTRLKPRATPGPNRRSRRRRRPASLCFSCSPCSPPSPHRRDHDGGSTHANAEVRTAVLHDVCEVHGNEKRDQLDAKDRAAYASILKELQRSLDANDDPGGGDADILRVRAWPAKAPGKTARSPSGLFEGAASAPHRHRHCRHQRRTMPTRIAVCNQQHANRDSLPPTPGLPAHPVPALTAGRRPAATGQQ